MTTELERCLVQLNEVTRELESLSYTVSHDLRAPLRHIEAFIGLLQQSLAGKLDDTSTEYFGIVAQSIRQMTQLLEGVLSYSRLCQREIHPTSVSLDQVVSAVLQDFKLEAEGRQVQWQIEPLPEVQGDPWMLRQVLFHLISNALKFTRDSSPATIRIDAVTSANEITLRVRDNGVGFDMQYANRLFGLFQRLHSDPRFEGAGLGLAHVRRIVLRQGGRVWAEASPGGGATFFIALPTPARE